MQVVKVSANGSFEMNVDPGIVAVLHVKDYVAGKTLDDVRHQHGELIAKYNDCEVTTEKVILLKDETCGSFWRDELGNVVVDKEDYREGLRYCSGPYKSEQFKLTIQATVLEKVTKRNRITDRVTVGYNNCSAKEDFPSFMRLRVHISYSGELLVDKEDIVFHPYNQTMYDSILELGLGVARMIAKVQMLFDDKDALVNRLVAGHGLKALSDK